MTRCSNLVAALLGVLLFLGTPVPGRTGFACAAAGAAPQAASDSRMGAPPPLPLIDAPDPLRPARRFERRSWQASLDVEAQRSVCLWEDCAGGGGYAVGASLLQRPTPYFSWGARLELEHSAHSMDYAGVGRETWTLNAQSAALLARLWFLAEGRLDPYLQIGAGLGRLQLNDTWHDGSGIEEQHSSNSLVPSYDLTLGLDVLLGDAFRVGASVSWSQWLLSTGQRCPVALGVCTQAHWGMFDLQNANLGVGISVSAVWGDAL